MNIFDLSGKTAIVTGGSRGIGFTIARGLAQAGASVAIANRKAAEGEKAAGVLQKEGLKATAIAVDVTDISSIEAMLNKAVSKFGKIDILVNNAGVVFRGPAENFSEENYDTIMNTNLKGVFFCCQFAGREMIKSKKGKIINVSSLVAERLQNIRTVYSASKAGLNHMSRSLALEWGKYNINVNVLAPTTTITDINRKYYMEEHPEEFQGYVNQTPLGRLANLEDYVGTAVYLASDASNFVTGQVIYVDGGITL
jgi:NAD(P)-dependent dehydrogenase (short-subunit alcohol dehydrogenase family)